MPINQSEVTKKIELETNNELSTLYHKYLQTKMELLIQKHKSQDREKDVHIGVASLARENENSEEKLDEIQMRKIEMNGLNEIQKILDKQITEIKKSLGKIFFFNSIFYSCICSNLFFIYNTCLYICVLKIIFRNF